VAGEPRDPLRVLYPEDHLVELDNGHEKAILRGAGLAVILLTVSLGAKTAQGATCEGYCTVTCGSGAVNVYYEPTTGAATTSARLAPMEAPPARPSGSR
jgi:hypothetical protein